MSTATLTPVATATIETGGLTKYLHIAIDGDQHCLRINTDWLALHPGMTLSDEAARLLALYAGYAPAGDWQQTKPGFATVDVAEIPGRCLTCVHGCGCEAGSAGCGHHGCWFASDAIANTCPGAAAHLAARRPSRRRTR